MEFDLDKLNPLLVGAWEYTTRRWPDDVKPNLKPLQEIEKDTKASFPNDYLDFMQRYGSLQMRLDDPQFLFIQYKIGNNIRKDTGSVQVIAPSKVVLEQYMLLSRPHIHYPDIGAQIPPKMVPIGLTAAGGEYFLMDLSEKNYGTIWHKDPGSTGTWGSENNTILGYAGASFTAFLANLKTEEEIQKIEAQGG
mgnify:CR=1 FL=1